MLDDLDQSVTKLVEVTRILPSFQHWTNYVEANLETDPVLRSRLYVPKRKWGDTFLTFAFRAGLRMYFREKLAENPAIVNEKQGRPLLDYILRPHIASWPSAPLSLDITVLNLVLEQGADPNQRSEGLTVCEQFIESLINFPELRAWPYSDKLQAMRLLINYGAQDGIINVSSGTMNPVLEYESPTIDMIRRFSTKKMHVN